MVRDVHEILPTNIKSESRAVMLCRCYHGSVGLWIWKFRGMASSERVELYAWNGESQCTSLVLKCGV